MPTWHQEREDKKLPKLSHPVRWSSYNPTGQLSVMRHFTKDTCMTYCNKTGDIPVPPDWYKENVHGHVQSKSYP
jgi:hypothetical protein